MESRFPEARVEQLQRPAGASNPSIVLVVIKRYTLKSEAMS